eukprot:5252894-Amphidinium_carterae.1
MTPHRLGKGLEEAPSELAATGRPSVTSDPKPKGIALSCFGPGHDTLWCAICGAYAFSALAA